MRCCIPPAEEPAKPLSGIADVPYTAEGWTTSTKLQKSFRGGTRISRDIRDFIEDKRQELLNERKPEAVVEEIIFSQWGGLYREKEGGNVAFHVSPATIDGLKESGKLIPKTAPPAPDGWHSLESMKAEYLGKKIRKKIAALIREKHEALLNEGYTPEKAKLAVTARWAGVYAVPESPGALPAQPGAEQVTDLFISPEALQLLEKSGKLVRNDKLAPATWHTGLSLEGDYVGGHELIDSKLRSFAQGRTHELVAWGAPLETAQQMTRKNWGNMLKSRKGGQMAFHISPGGVTVMERTGKLIPIEKSPPLVKPGWKSGSRLEKENQHVGSTRSFNAAIADYIVLKEAQMKASGMSNEEAAQVVFKNQAGRYRSEQGRPALYIHPDGIRELEAAGVLIRRDGKAQDSHAEQELHRRGNGKVTEIE